MCEKILWNFFNVLYKKKMHTDKAQLKLKCARNTLKAK